MFFPQILKQVSQRLNADETLLGGAWSSDEEKEILKNNPAKSSYFNLIYEAKLNDFVYCKCKNRSTD